MRIIRPDADFNAMTPPSGTKAVARLLTDDELKSVPESYLSSSSLFMAHCPCGSEDFYIKAEDGIIYLICSLCGYRFVIYNPLKHGILSLQRHGDNEPSEEKAYCCTSCNGEIFKTLFIYNYASNKEQPESNILKPEDAFWKFFLSGTCINCGTRDTIKNLNC